MRDIRKEANLTQIELAEKLNRKQPYVSKYEKGDRRLDIFEVYAICEACGITFSELAERTEMAFKRFKP